MSDKFTATVTIEARYCEQVVELLEIAAKLANNGVTEAEAVGSASYRFKMEFPDRAEAEPSDGRGIARSDRE